MPPKAKKIKRRKDLATYVGRAIVLKSFHELISSKGGAAKAEAEIGIALTADEREYIDALDWNAISPHIKAIRDLLPTTETGTAGELLEDAAGW